MKLTLKKETLAVLSDDELATVNGGITTILIKSLQDCGALEAYPTFPVLYCATDATS